VDTSEQLADEHRAAAELADEAGAVLVELRSGPLTGKELGREGDGRAHRLLMTRLSERFPADRVRSEEADRSEELGPVSGRVWIVDPLDGTREYSEGREDWAVHVALAIDGHPVVGAVALPALGVVLGTARPPALAPARALPRMVVSRTRPPWFVPAVAERLGAETLPMGSAGAKISAVMRGEAEVYVHAGGQYEWDSAAPVAVALRMGLHATRLDGSPLRYSQPDPWLPDLVVCHPSLATAVMEALEAVGATREEGPEPAGAGTGGGG
jgi:3'(2'), 5'-bisphosphate nucleotidase